MLQQYKLGENVYLSKAYTSECWCPLARQDFLATCSGGTLRNAPARRAGASVSFVYLPGATAGYHFALWTSWFPKFDVWLTNLNILTEAQEFVQSFKLMSTKIVSLPPLNSAGWSDDHKCSWTSRSTFRESKKSRRSIMSTCNIKLTKLITLNGAQEFVCTYVQFEIDETCFLCQSLNHDSQGRLRQVRFAKQKALRKDK